MRAPTLVTGFMSTGVKAAAFAAFLRVFLSAFEPLHVVGAGAVRDRGITMLLGTIVGVAQSNVTHAPRASPTPGTAAGIIAGNPAGKAAVLFYVAPTASPIRLRHPRGAVDRVGRTTVRDLPARTGVPAGRAHGVPARSAGSAHRRVHRQGYLQRGAAEGLVALAILGVLTSVISSPHRRHDAYDGRQGARSSVISRLPWQAC
jgi:hypothetical protein